MKLKHDIDFYRAYTKREKNSSSSSGSGVGVLPLVIAAGAVLLAGSYALLTYQNSRLEHREAELQEYLRSSPAAETYTELQTLRGEYQNISLYNSMVSTARETITDRAIFTLPLYQAFTSSLSGLGTLNGMMQQGDTLTLTATLTAQGYAAEYEDALVSTGYFRTVSHSGWRVEGGYYAEFTCIIKKEVNVG